MGGNDSAGGYRVWRVADGSLSAVELLHLTRESMLPYLPSAAAEVRARLATHPAGVLVTVQWYPYQTLLVDLAGRHRTVLTPRSLLADDSLLKANRQWVVSLPSVFFGEGYIQTLASLEGDDRWILLFDRGGRSRRILHLTVPLGMAGADQERHVLVAVRRTNGAAIVEYKWRWGAPKKGDSL